MTNGFDFRPSSIIVRIFAPILSCGTSRHVRKPARRCHDGSSIAYNQAGSLDYKVTRPIFDHFFYLELSSKRRKPYSYTPAARHERP